MKKFLLIMSIVFAVAALVFFIISVSQGTYINIQATVFFAACAVISAVNLVGMLIVSRLDRLCFTPIAPEVPASDDPDFTTAGLSLRGMNSAIPNAVRPVTRGRYYIRKSWDDEASQAGLVTELNIALKMAETRPGYHVYDQTGKEILPDSPEGNA